MTLLEQTFGPPADDEATEPAFRFSPFEGLEVIGSRIEIRNIAGGLREAMDVAPIELHQGDEFDITLRCKTRGIRHDPAEKDEPDGQQYRVHIADASRAVIVDQSLAAAEFDAQAERIAQRKEIAGQQKAEFPQLSPPWLGYEDETAGEVTAKIADLGDDDADLVDAIELWEEANGSRADILHAIKTWRDDSSS